jgi:hypothetical protein
MASLVAFADRESFSVRTATAEALYSIIAGGVGHVILVPGTTGGVGWSDQAIADVDAAVSATVNEHGEGIPVTLSTVSPRAVQESCPNFSRYCETRAFY